MDNEVLIYCPNCSRQLVWYKEHIGEEVSCPYCQHQFATALPKKSTRNSAVIGRAITIVSMIIGMCFAKTVAPKLMDEFWPGAKEKKEAKRLLTLAEEDGERFRQYGNAIKNSGVLDIYMSETMDELHGLVDKRKYSQALERALIEAEELHLWCDSKMESLENIKVSNSTAEKAKKLLSEGYEGYYNLTKLGMELFSKTIEAHKAYCGQYDDATLLEREAYNRLRKKAIEQRDVYGRRSTKPEEELIKSALECLDVEICLLVNVYSNEEEKMLKRIMAVMNDID